MNLTPRWMLVKLLLFVVIGVTSSGMILAEDPGLLRAGLLVAFGWAVCRAYYFCFYAVEHYVDGRYRFAGLIDFARWWWRGGVRRADGGRGRDAG